ncbi:MAG: hypothetical protein GY739_00195, partial [Mesoflavibacter sp.]|nr:hypothetical protein [Mesoflavibacter sp.]
MSKASDQTFIKQLEAGNIETNKGKIYDFIKSEPNTNTGIIKNQFSNIEESTVTGRISDLLDIGVIKITGEIFDYSRYVIVTNKKEQTKLSDKRYNEKTQRLIKSLLKRNINQELKE